MATKVYGVRLPPALDERLWTLCALAQRCPSAVLRALVAAATPESLPRAWREGTREELAMLAEIERP